MTRDYYEFHCPVKILAGLRALEHMAFELDRLGARRPLLVTDAGLRKVGLLDHVQQALRSGGIDADAVFDQVPPDSSLHTVRLAAQAWREAGCDAIVAVGGGSVIDTAKATNILASEGGDDLRKYAGAHNLKRPLKPLFVVPTTLIDCKLHDRFAGQFRWDEQDGGKPQFKRVAHLVMPGPFALLLTARRFDPVQR